MKPDFYYLHLFTQTEKDIHKVIKSVNKLWIP